MIAIVSPFGWFVPPTNPFRGSWRLVIFAGTSTSDCRSCECGCLALRERPHDIGTLLDELCPFEPSNIPLSARHVLYSYDYPGNIRELRNILIDLSIQNANGGIDVEQLKALLRDKTASTVGDTSISLNRKITVHPRGLYSTKWQHPKDRQSLGG